MTDLNALDLKSQFHWRKIGGMISIASQFLGPDLNENVSTEDFSDLLDQLDQYSMPTPPTSDEDD